MPEILQVELKLSVAGPEAPRLLEALVAEKRLGDIRFALVGRHDIVDTYYDTPGRALQRDRGYLRERSVDDAPGRLTYRQSSAGMGAEQSIIEVQSDVDQLGIVVGQLRADHPELPTPDSDLPTAVQRLASMELEPILNVRFGRDILRLTAQDDSPIRIKLDRISYPGFVQEFYEIEVDFAQRKLASFAADVYLRLMGVAGAAGMPTTTSKLERGLLLKWLRQYEKTR